MARTKAKAKKHVAEAKAQQPRKRRRMWRSAWQREIKACQKATHNLVPKSPMHRCIRELANTILGESRLRWKQGALDLLHVEAEEYVRAMFFRANNYLVNAGRCTMRVQDVKAAHADMLAEAERLRAAAK